MRSTCEPVETEALELQLYGAMRLHIPNCRGAKIASDFARLSIPTGRSDCRPGFEP